VSGKEAFEPDGRQLGVSHRVLDRPMTEIILDASRIVAVIGKFVAAGVPQHVDVDREAELGPLANGLDLPIERVRRERRAALAGEHKRGVRPLVGAEFAQCPQFIAADRMGCRLAILDAPDVQRGGLEIDLRPFQVASLDSTQTMPVNDEDERAIAVRVAARFGGLNQFVDLGGC